MTPTTDRPLDLTWDAPLPHALTRTRTYLSTPSSSTQVAIIAIHGRGDNARDFAEAFVPHLRSYFGPHLLGEVEEKDSPAADSKNDGEKGLKITLRALEARDGIWFGSHTRKFLLLPPSFSSHLLIKKDHNSDSIGLVGGWQQRPKTTSPFKALTFIAVCSSLKTRSNHCIELISLTPRLCWSVSVKGPSSSIPTCCVLFNFSPCPRMSK